MTGRWSAEERVWDRLVWRLAPASAGWAAVRAHAEAGLGLASVLVPIVLRPVPSVVLTVRSAGLRGHAGQVCFPGGRADPGDRDVGSTALREAEEEIGLPASCVRVLGCLPPQRTRTSSNLVVPAVGLIPAAAARWRAAPAEVEEVFELPFTALLDPALPARCREGARAGAWVWRWEARDIWGVTAAILVSLADALRSARHEADL